MRKVLFVFLFPALFMVFACSKKPDSSPSVEVIDGIEHVHNTGTPLHVDRTVTFVEELAIGGEEYDMLFQPRGFVVDRNGNIHIQDFQDQSIKVFGPNGEYMHSIGRKGEGPGEFSYIGQMAVLPDGRLWVTDGMTRRLNLFDSEGKYIESYHWKQGFGRFLYATDSTCLLSIYTFEGDHPLENRKLFVKEFDFQGNEIRSFGEFKIEDSKVYTEKMKGGATIYAVAPPFSPQSIFAGDPVRKYLYHCVNDEYRIEVFDKEGKIVGRFDRPYEPVPFTFKDAEEFLARYEKARSDGLKKMARELPMPKMKTVMSRMLVDDEGNIWVETHEKKEERDRVFTAYDIFNPEGFYEARVWIDLKPELFVKGKMYCWHTEEETGYRYLKRCRVVWGDLSRALSH